MTGQLLMSANSSQKSASTVDLLDPFGDGSGVALYKFDGDALAEAQPIKSYNTIPSTNQYYFNDMQSDALGTWSNVGNMPVAKYYNSFVTKNYIYSFCADTASLYRAPIDTNGIIGTFSLYATTSFTGVDYNGSGFIIIKNRVYTLGHSNTSSIYYATINEDGSISSFSIYSTALPYSARGKGFACLGEYIYILGGYTDNGYVYRNTVYYAKISETGEIGNFVATTSLPTTRLEMAVTAFNGKIYMFGGYGSSSTTYSTCYYAIQNNDGTLGSWIAMSNLPTTLCQSSCITTKNAIYLINGATGVGTRTANIYKAPIVNGVVGAFVLSSTSLSASQYTTIIATSSRLYRLGFYNGSQNSTIYSVPFSGGMDDYSSVLEQDVINHTYDGTASNVTYGTGKFGQCAVFNGSNAYIDSGFNLFDRIPQNIPTTISCFIKGVGGIICMSGYMASISKNLSTKKIEILLISYYGGILSKVISSEAYNDIDFHHIVGVFSYKTVTLYVNGVFVGTNTGTDNLTTDIQTSKNILIGKFNHLTSPSYFNGSIDQFRIFNRALTQTEVTALYNEGQ